MTPSQAAIILGVSAAFDRRTVGEADARSWSDVLDGIDFDDAIQAVKNHYAKSRDFLYPSDVIAGVKAIENQRIEAGPNLEAIDPPEWLDPDDEFEYRRWLRDQANNVRRGLPIDIGTPPEIANSADRIKAITEGLARDKKAPGTVPRDESA
jgi:hypothetical protein